MAEETYKLPRVLQLLDNAARAAAAAQRRTDSADALATARNITLVGDVAGSASFDGAADASISVTLKDASALHSAGGSRSAVVGAGTAFTVPAYIPGSGRLQVYLDGVLCMGGDDAAINAYKEIPGTGNTSQTIQFHQDIETDIEIFVRVL